MEMISSVDRVINTFSVEIIIKSELFKFILRVRIQASRIISFILLNPLVAFYRFL